MDWAEFAAIAVAHLLAVASPGPDFAVVLRQTLIAGSRVGVWTSAGVATAIGLHVSYCLLGVALLISQSPSLFSALKFGAALFLIYLGQQSLRAAYSASRSAGPALNTQEGERERFSPEVSEQSAAKAFALGFVTNGLNPKATLFFLALFGVVIRPETSFLVQVGYGVYLALATFVWFACLSLLLGSRGVRQFVERAAPAIDAVMGAVLLGLSFQLLLGTT